MTLLAGHAQAVITPNLERSVFLAGFGQNRRAESVHDDLYAHALATQFGTTTVLMIALDLLGLGPSSVPRSNAVCVIPMPKPTF